MDLPRAVKIPGVEIKDVHLFLCKRQFLFYTACKESHLGCSFGEKCTTITIYS